MVAVVLILWTAGGESPAFGITDGEASAERWMLEPVAPRNCCPYRRLDLRPSGHDLPVRESEHTVPSVAEEGVASSIRLESVSMMLRAVDFDHEALADDEIDPPDARDRDLSAHPER